MSRNYPENVLRWCELITQYGNEHGIDPDLLAALILQESGGNPTAYSHSGAVGLMQVMPNDGLAASFMCQNGPCFKIALQSLSCKIQILMSLTDLRCWLA